MNIPFVDLKTQYLSIKQEIDKAIFEVLNDANFIGGEQIGDFESKFASLYGVKHVIGVANGTDAIYIVLKMLGIGVGDEVITTASSWISTAETITQTGAKPIFVDIDPETYTINPGLIEEKITKRTKAIIPVHLYGQMADIVAIKNICDKHNLYLIEDCAQSHFSEEKGRLAGRYGVAGTFSFYPGKNLGAYGDAGCIITDDDLLAEKCRMFANHGALKKHEHQIEGINSRLDTLQAAVLNVKANYIINWTNSRISNATFYNTTLKNVEEITLPIVRNNTKHTFHLYVIRTKKRDALKEHLRSMGIQTAIHYPTALPNLTAYKYLGHSRDDYPVASRYQDEIISIPMYPEISKEQMEYVCNGIKSFFKL
ncbi:MAG: DegT/DnrJ/EryC1/StrS family aminotransferase [Cyclobacteriaceae bacterium]|nr:DegT/DnrJ/EryC1/StrS family aminotransferase [Cyclobacteriaceae bacterium]